MELGDLVSQTRSFPYLHRASLSSEMRMGLTSIILCKMQNILPTDATNLLLWLDADDNSTLFANSNPSVSALAATTVGRWQDKGMTIISVN